MACGAWICGAIIAMIIGFAWGCKITPADHPQNDERRGGLAGSGGLFSVAQFMKEPNHQEKLQELEASPL